MHEPEISPTAVVRHVFGGAALVTGLLAWLVREPRLFAAAAVFGVMWTAWDLLTAFIFEPVADFIARLASGDRGQGVERGSTLPTLDDTVRLLENHLRGAPPRHVGIQSAVRLEEIYRVVKKDPAKAREVIALARSLYPDAPELTRYE